LDEALELANSFNPKQIFVTGGTYFYTEALNHPNCTNLFITEVLSESTWEYDTFFPEYKHLDLKAYNITNEAISWMSNNDALFVKNKLPQLVHNKEEEYIIDGNEVKYKFMLYLKQNN
jgi:dihydrofolate reductase